ncbi:MAG: RsmD family RNA methyltransferase [Candidatus Omnitrophota bacterium]
MRIIGGTFRGRKIIMPEGIRPTQDKVREAFFDILGDVKGIAFLELYAGSGAVGLEAVSRGAAESAMVEDNRACLKVIEKNIGLLGIAACSLYPLQAGQAIKAFFERGRKFDVIFLDPPYHTAPLPAVIPRSDAHGGIARFHRSKEAVDVQSLAKKTLQILGAYDILAPNGLIAAQHFKKDVLPQTAGDLILFRQFRYGDTLLSLYKREQGEGAQEA